MAMKENRRVKMTKRLIKDAYLELLEQLPSERITVTSICNAADVNRSTFYMYYEDTNFLRQEIESEIIEQITVIAKCAESTDPDQEFIDMLERFFTYIQENDRMFRALLLRSDGRRFNRRMIETVLSQYQSESDAKNPVLAAYSYVYCVSGVIGILGTWMEENFPFSAKEFAEMAYKMSFLANEIVNL